MRILISIDHSEPSLHALDYLKGQADLLGQDPDITILNVQPPLPARIVAMEDPEGVQQYYKEETDRVFEAARARLGNIKNVKYVYRVGNPADMIVAEAKALKVDLVIMGNRGHGSLGALLFGSVSNSVLAHIDCPVLMLRQMLPVDPRGLRVGIAVDGSAYSQRAVDYVLAHPDLFGKDPTFTLINVATDFSSIIMPSMAGVPIQTMNKREVADIQEEGYAKALNPLMPLFEAKGIKPTVAKLVGNPGDAIVKYARQERLDLLVMGSHGYDKMDAVLLGSVAMRIAATSELPLLIIH